MVMKKIIWSAFAKKELKDIHDYYKYNISASIAQNIKEQIISATLYLLKYPQMGAIETNLITFGRNIRYLVSGNYKIIYVCENDIIHILKAFDCRLNPDKMNENIK
jgi:plasmid stabilization system protein ParE